MPPPRGAGQRWKHMEIAGAQPAPRPPPDAQVCRGGRAPLGHQAGGPEQPAVQISGQFPERHTPDRGQTGGHCIFSSLITRERKAEGRIKVLWRDLGHVRGILWGRAFNCRALGSPQQCLFLAETQPYPPEEFYDVPTTRLTN